MRDILINKAQLDVYKQLVLMSIPLSSYKLAYLKKQKKPKSKVV